MGFSMKQTGICLRPVNTVRPSILCVRQGVRWMFNSSPKLHVCLRCLVCLLLWLFVQLKTVCVAVNKHNSSAVKVEFTIEFNGNLLPNFDVNCSLTRCIIQEGRQHGLVNKITKHLHIAYVHFAIIIKIHIFTYLHLVLNLLFGLTGTKNRIYTTCQLHIP